MPTGRKQAEFAKQHRARLSLAAAGSLARYLHRIGYFTAGVSANPIVSPGTFAAFGGFDSFGEKALLSLDSRPLEDQILDLYGASDTEFNRLHIRSNSGSVNRVVFEALEKYLEVQESAPDKRPLFLFINYLDPHDPYFPFPPFDDLFGISEGSSFNGDLRSELGDYRDASRMSDADLERLRLLYDREIAQMDHNFGALLDRLREIGIMDNFMIWVTADHGELLGEGGRLTHDVERVHERIQRRVPLVFASSHLKFMGDSLDELVWLSDILPTIADFTGGPCPPGAEGKSLRQVLLSVSEMVGQWAESPERFATDWNSDWGKNSGFDEDDEPISEDSPEKELEKRLRALGYLD